MEVVAEQIYRSRRHEADVEHCHPARRHASVDFFAQTEDVPFVQMLQHIETSHEIERRVGNRDPAMLDQAETVQPSPPSRSLDHARADVDAETFLAEVGSAQQLDDKALPATDIEMSVSQSTKARCVREAQSIPGRP